MTRYRSTSLRTKVIDSRCQAARQSICITDQMLNRTVLMHSSLDQSQFSNGCNIGKKLTFIRTRSNIDLLRHFQRIIDFYTQVANSAVKICVAEQQLNRPQVLGAPIDQGRFCAPQRMCSIRRWIQPDSSHPLIDDSSVLAR